MKVRVIHNPDATIPLPLWVFSEPQDRQIIRLNDRWIEFQCRPAVVRHSATRIRLRGPMRPG
jgi:hypothetical protein